MSKKAIAELAINGARGKCAQSGKDRKQEALRAYHLMPAAFISYVLVRCKLYNAMYLAHTEQQPSAPNETRRCAGRFIGGWRGTSVCVAGQP